MSACGIRGRLEPEYPFKGVHEQALEYEGITVTIKDGMINADFLSESDIEKAKAVIKHVLDAWNARHNIKATVKLKSLMETS